MRFLIYRTSSKPDSLQMCRAKSITVAWKSSRALGLEHGLSKPKP